MMDMRKSNVLILGGTGTLGRALVRTLSHEYPGINISVLSRDEHKQAHMRREFPKVRFIIGDIRDLDQRHFVKQDIVFHVAALKHVDGCEANVGECIKTNVLGTMNAADAAIAAGVRHFIFSSTDKAVDPINTYGYSKALSEKVLISYNKLNLGTKFSIYRWGNVLGSQGSVIPIFAETLRKERAAYITHQSMTRYWLPIDWAVRFMLRTFPDARTDRAMICPNMKSASVLNIVKAVASIVGVPQYRVAPTGVRPGEKIHEVMESQHAPTVTVPSSDAADEYTEEELIEMLKPILQGAS